jgi:low temperature requirement protein LtrA
MRSGYVWAQGHLLVFAGIAATAVGLEFMIEAAADGRDLELADRLPLGAGIASYLVAMALIRSATRRWDWVVGLRLATGGVVLVLSLVGGIGPLPLVAAITAIVVAEVAFELHRAPAEAARSRPRLPHELRRPRGSG